MSKVTQTAVIRLGGETEARTGKLLTVAIKPASRAKWEKLRFEEVKCTSSPEVVKLRMGPRRGLACHWA